jgi:hypothetical protein
MQHLHEQHHRGLSGIPQRLIISMSRDCTAGSLTIRSEARGSGIVECAKRRTVESDSSLQGNCKSRFSNEASEPSDEVMVRLVPRDEGVRARGFASTTRLGVRPFGCEVGIGPIFAHSFGRSLGSEVYTMARGRAPRR